MSLCLIRSIFCICLFSCMSASVCPFVYCSVSLGLCVVCLTSAHPSISECTRLASFATKWRLCDAKEMPYSWRLIDTGAIDKSLQRRGALILRRIRHQASVVGWHRRPTGCGILLQDDGELGRRSRSGQVKEGQNLSGRSWLRCVSHMAAFEWWIFDRGSNLEI